MEAQFWNHEEQNPQWSINHPPYMYFDVLIVMTYSNWCSATELGVRPRAWCDLWCFPIGYSCKIPAVYWKCFTLNNKLVLSLNVKALVNFHKIFPLELALRWLCKGRESKSESIQKSTSLVTFQRATVFGQRSWTKSESFWVGSSLFGPARHN